MKVKVYRKEDGILIFDGDPTSTMPTQYMGPNIYIGDIELPVTPLTKTVTREARIASMSTYPGGVSSVASEFIPAGAKNIRVVYDLDVPANEAGA